MKPTDSISAIFRKRLDNRGAALLTVIAVFAAVSVLAASITSLVLSSATLSSERNCRAQAYLTAKSVLNVTAGHIGSISGNRAEVAKFAGKTATGELPDMGDYTATIEWNGQSSVKITVTGSFKGQSSTLVAFVDGIGGGA